MVKNKEDIITFMHDFNAFCKAHDCGYCPLTRIPDTADISCFKVVETRFDETVKVLDEWKLKKQVNLNGTRLEKFLKCYPDTKADPDGTPMVCVKTLGYDSDILCDVNCLSCWLKPEDEKPQCDTDSSTCNNDSNDSDPIIKAIITSLRKEDR